MAFFNDSIRDGLKGSVFEASDTGFVSGKPGQETLIANNVLGCQNPEGLSPCTNGNANTGYAAPGQIVNYVEIHDNLTLFDKLLASRPNDSEQTRAARAKLANSAVYLAQGIPAAQLGQEFLRTKGGDENSYNSGDGPNAIDWSRAHEQADSVAYTRGLLALRQSAPAFRYPTFEQVNANSKLLRAADGVVAWTVRDTEHSYVVVLNSTDAAVPVDIPAGTYDLLVANGKVELSAPQTVTIGETPYAAGALSATVLRLHTDNAGEPGAEDADQTGAEDAGQAGGEGTEAGAETGAEGTEAGAEDAGQTGAEDAGLTGAEGADKPAVEKPVGVWAVENDARGVLYVNAWGQGKADRTVNYGNPNDEIIFGDWDGDGIDTPLVRRGNAFLGTNGFGGVAQFEFAYGNAGDAVLVGDWNGDGKDTIAVVRGNQVFVRSSLTSGVADAVYGYGNPTDTLIAGDWNGDGKDTLAAVRGNIFYVQSKLEDTKAPLEFTYGTAGDRVIVGDWNGTGKDGVGVVRGNQFFLKNKLVTGAADEVFAYGNAKDVSVVGDWDGDGIDTLAVDRR
ncbi:pullulanase [Actinobaculum suis]|uniref:Pullulanase n=1 Tax=Actinobaculum suis TaxID=1657 RepID=A0A7Z9CAJ3_9ACTO|nr:hypothetical protein [Actinobaculum suis]VDG79600.1 pullulanase [Actinobaculum suis]